MVVILSAGKIVIVDIQVWNEIMAIQVTPDKTQHKIQAWCTFWSPRSKLGLDWSARPGLLFNCQSLDQQIGNSQEHYIGALGRNGRN